MAGRFKFRGAVHFVDGSTEEFEAGNAALVAWERYAMRHKMPMGKDSAPTLSSLVIAHHALGIATGIDAWIETIDGIDLEADDGKAEPVPPTPEDPSPAEESSSQ